MRVFHKKSQAAMEFLMTYGWAILAAVIAIGVLASMGVFSPGKYSVGAAVVTAPFYVVADNAKASVGVTLELRNDGGESYTIQSVKVTNCGTNSTSIPISTSTPEVVIITCAPVLTEGDSLKGDITITYRKSGSSVDLTSTGTVSRTVTA